MDTTHIDELIARLEETDPGDAPEIVDEITTTLTDALDDVDSPSPGGEER